MISKNSKKADLPVMVLVIGVISIVILAILSFYLPLPKAKSEILENIKIMEKINSKIEVYEFYKLQKIPEATLKKIDFLKTDLGEIYIEEIGSQIKIKYHVNPSP